MTDQAKTTKTVLGADCRITGDLTIDNDAVVMGQFKGTLRVSGLLEVTDSAKVTGTIIVGGLRLAGRAEANVVAEQGVELLAGAQLSGKLYTTTLAIVEGAVFTGDVCVGPKAMQAAGALLREVSIPDDADTQDEQIADEAPAAMAMQAGEEQGEEQWDDQAETQEIEAPAPQQPAAAPVRTVASSLNSILARRRAKVLGNAVAGKVGQEQIKTARAS